MTRTKWDKLPEFVRNSVEHAVGAKVRRARDQVGGFSPGFATRLEFSDGRRFFGKGTDAKTNAATHSLLCGEANVMIGMDDAINRGNLPIPRLRQAFSSGSWAILLFDDIDGQSPTSATSHEFLEDLGTTLARIHRDLSPVDAELPSAADKLADAFHGWHRVAESGNEGRLAPWLAMRFDELLQLEREWGDGLPSDAVLHTDLRLDNLVVTPMQIYIVDWAHACLGPAWLDIALMAPSIRARGGPPPADLLRQWCQSRPPQQQLTAAVAAMTGYLVANTLSEPAVGLSNALASWQAQAPEAVRWLRECLRR